jgi:hypothetical protein
VNTNAGRCQIFIAQNPLRRTVGHHAAAGDSIPAIRQRQTLGCGLNRKSFEDLRKGLFATTGMFISNDGQLEAIPLQRKRETGVFLVNLGLRESVSISSERCLFWVWVHFQFPRPDGLSDSKEAPTLYKMCPAARRRWVSKNIWRDKGRKPSRKLCQQQPNWTKVEVAGLQRRLGFYNNPITEGGSS